MVALTNDPMARPLVTPAQGTLAAFLGAVEEQLAVSLAGTGLLEQVARPMVLAPESKRARPMVAWLVGRALGVNAALVLDVAVAVELVHAASLLHDDVVDGATERRGLPSANVRWGSTMAVLSGDLLLTSALTRLRSLGPQAIGRAVEIVAEMTRAVAAEVAMRRRVDLTLEQWRTMAEGKTGALFGIAAWLVAMVSGDGARAERFERALRHLGVAFQIADDASDLAGDLSDGSPSFPVILATQLAPCIRTSLEVAWHEGEPQSALVEIAVKVAASGALRLAAEQVRSEIGAARVLLAPELAAKVPGIATIVSWAEALASAAEERYPRASEPGRTPAPGREEG